MLLIRSSASMAHALASPLDPALRSLLITRRDQLAEYAADLGAFANFVIAEPGDDIPMLERTICMPIAGNIVDGCRFGDPGFEPSWEWLLDHGGWFEMTFILSDDGYGHVLFVPDRDDIDGELLALCRTFSHT